MAYTSAELDEIFKIFSDDAAVDAIKNEARELLRAAEHSKQFDSVAATFFHKTLEAVTAGGLNKKPVQMMMLVLFILGQRTGKPVLPALDPPLDEIQIDPDRAAQWLTELEKDFKNPDPNKKSAWKKDGAD